MRRSAATARRRRGLFAAELAGGLATIAFSGVASAYTTVGDLPEFESDDPVRWTSGTIRYVIRDDLPRGMTLEAVERTTQTAVSSWSGLSCEGGNGGPTFVHEGATDVDAAPGDGVSTIQFVYSGWYLVQNDPQAAALTDAQYVRDPGGTWRIVEADIYLNAQHFDWVLRDAADEGERDIRSVITHEAGHVIGLAHPCEEGAADGLPDCAEDPSFAETTMYPYYDATQSALSADDVAGACFLYPAGTLSEPDDAELPCDGADCDASAGDPCTASNQCASGWCNDAGFCATPCERGEDCPAEARCERVGAHNRVCVGGVALGGMGAPCEDAEDCVGGRCVQEDEEAPYCSRDCGEGAVACPTDWQCAVVDGAEVCVGARHVFRGGCAIGRRPAVPREQGSAFPLVLFGLGALGSVRLVRRGTGTSWYMGRRRSP